MGLFDVLSAKQPEPQNSGIEPPPQGSLIYRLLMGPRTVENFYPKSYAMEQRKGAVERPLPEMPRLPVLAGEGLEDIGRRAK